MNSMQEHPVFAPLTWGCCRLVGILLISVQPAFAGETDGLRLAMSNGCLACHDVTQSLSGPSYLDVAKRYQFKDRKRLVTKVLNGGSGSWGSTSMPANKDNGLTVDAATRLVDWILSLKH
jgi:cytochrome c